VSLLGPGHEILCLGVKACSRTVTLSRFSMVLCMITR